MLWNVKAVEDLTSGDFVEFMPDVHGKLCCKKASKLHSISAMAARDILKDETLTFDTRNDTRDLVGVKDPS